MEVHVLGSLELIDEDGVQVAVNGRRLRTLLGHLALHANTVLTSDYLIELLWGDALPQDPRGALQVQVSRLRKLVGDSIRTRDSGYMLSLSPDDLDAAVFERLVGEGRRAASAGVHSEAVERFRTAFSLWAGGPAGDGAEIGLNDEALASWLELRRAAEEDLMESELELGRDQQMIAELQQLATAEPFRERRWSQLMLALYRAGRQAEALNAFKRLSSTLGDELGIEPSLDLKHLEERILLQDPTLLLNPDRHTTQTSVETGTYTFVVAFGEGLAVSGIAQLRDLVQFEGEQEEMCLASSSTIAAVEGARHLAEAGACVGIHLGEASYENDTYVGLAIHLTRRIAAVALPGQVLLSSVVERTIAEKPGWLEMRALGDVRLPGVTLAEPLFQGLYLGPDESSGTPTAPTIRATNLPNQIDTFVGRARELHEVGRLLETNRLVTLTGPGGIGKTRLALQAAANRLSTHKDGVWFVDLTDVVPDGQIDDEIARVLQIPGYPTIEELEVFLDGRSLLLIIDNCEHVIDEAAEVVHRLLKASAELRVLATSRQRLGIPGEVGWTVPTMTAAVLASVHLEVPIVPDAVALFADRAASRNKDFAIDRDNISTIAELCRRLDGIPLAIELAAARIVALTPGEIWDRLNDRFSLLTTRDRGVQPRHRTLRDVIGWSHENLDTEEKVLFRRLAVFRGGFNRLQAETVCADESIQDHRVIDTLEGLAEKSLVTVEVGDDERRFGMLATIREFAQICLEAEHEEDFAGRHAAEFCRLAEAAEDHLGKSDGQFWFDALARDHENIVAALRWSSRKGDARIGAQLMAATASYWEMCGRWLEGVREAEALLMSQTLSDHHRGKVERVAALLLSYVGQLTTATKHAQAALHNHELAQDSDGVMRTLNLLGNIALDLGDYKSADDYYRRAIEASSSVGDLEYRGRILNNRGSLAQLRGNFDRAYLLYEQALEMAQRADNLTDQCYASLNLGEVAVERAQYKRAEQLFLQGLDLASASADRRGQAAALCDAGWVALKLENAAEALERLRASVQIFHAIGDSHNALLAVGRIAFAYHELGRIDRAALLVASEGVTRDALGFGPSQDREELADLASLLRSELGSTFSNVERQASEMTLEELTSEALKE